MKKIITVLILIIMVFAGCKKDETTPAGSKCLLTKYSVSEEGDDFVVNFKYDDDKKLINYSVIDNNNDVSLLTFQYNSEGNLQSYTEYYNSVEDRRVDFSYNGNILNVTFSDYDGGTWVIDDYKHIYELDTDGNITKDEEYHKDDQGTWQMRYYHISEWYDGNMVKDEQWNRTTSKNYSHTIFSFPHIINIENIPLVKSVDDDFILTHSTTNSYDDENNAMISLKGVPMFRVSKNNVISSITNHTSGETYNMTATYEYNEKGYPIKQTQTYEGEDPLIISFEYDCE